MMLELGVGKNGHGQKPSLKVFITDTELRLHINFFQNILFFCKEFALPEMSLV